MLKIGALVSGGGTNFQAIIDSIKNKKLNAEIVTVISSRQDAYAIERAKNNGIETVCYKRKDFATREEYGKKLVEHLKSRNVDLVVLAGFMIILSKNFIEAFENRIMNVHPSLIPAFCGEGFYGLKVHEAALAKGVKVTGATVHFVDGGTDSGPIILQKAVEIKDDDTPEILQRRVMEQAEWIILPEAIKLFSENKLKIENNIVRRLS